MQDKTLLYLYDLPKERTTSTVLASKIKELTQCDLNEPAQIRRDPNKPFYTAIVKINEMDKFKDVCQKMKYFDIDGKPCRGLPYTKELLAANRQNTNKANVFIKGIDKQISTQQLEQKFEEVLGNSVVQTAKVSLNEEYTSNGYGFVLFRSQDLAEQAQALSEKLGFEVHAYQPKDRRDVRKGFNNIYVKNFPNHWDESKLNEVFGVYGKIKSLYKQQAQVPGQPEGTLAPFAFICYEDPDNKEYGMQCALRAVEDLNDKEFDGHKLYVKEALKKTDRDNEKKKEQLRFKNSKKRCNLYVKNFPPTTTEQELRELFGKYGEIESIKMLPKEGEALYAFVCFKQPDAAALAKQQLNLTSFNNKVLYINNYELKEVRKIQQEDARDKADFQNYKKQSPAALSLDILNKPEIYQLIQYLMINLRNQQQNMRQGQNNRQGPGMRGPRPYNNNPQGQMQQRPPMQQQQNMMQQPPQMRPPQQQPPMMPPTNMPPQQFQGQPMMQPGMGAPINLPPHIIQYQTDAFRIYPAVLPQNPNYKTQVGEVIYDYVERLSSEIHAPKITGMLIDLPIPEIQTYLRDYNSLAIKVKEAHSLLQQQQ